MQERRVLEAGSSGPDARHTHEDSEDVSGKNTLLEVAEAETDIYKIKWKSKP
jgi:hypothetical protein